MNIFNMYSIQYLCLCICCIYNMYILLYIQYIHMYTCVHVYIHNCEYTITYIICMYITYVYIHAYMCINVHTYM